MMLFSGKLDVFAKTLFKKDFISGQNESLVNFQLDHCLNSKTNIEHYPIIFSKLIFACTIALFSKTYSFAICLIPFLTLTVRLHGLGTGATGREMLL